MKNPLVRRLAPLFIAKFLLCFVFWYSIEKLFMYSIGFNDASIGLMAAIYAVMSVFMEVPSGVLADRWSRKGVMILSALSMLLSSYFGWISNDPSLYVVSAAFWGFFDALASGTGSAMIYDLLEEEQGHTRNYDKILGRFEMLGGIALIISALLGGWLASARSLRSAFFATIITAGLAAVVLLFYRDTTIHKQSTDAKLIEHTKGTFAAVFKNPDLAWLVVVMLVVFLVQKMNGEFYQLWRCNCSLLCDSTTSSVGVSCVFYLRNRHDYQPIILANRWITICHWYIVICTSSCAYVKNAALSTVEISRWCWFGDQYCWSSDIHPMCIIVWFSVKYYEYLCRRLYDSCIYRHWSVCRVSR